jgi:hypothetical protein
MNQKNKTPWGIWGYGMLFFWALLLGLTAWILYAAIVHQSELVRDDYYEAGLTWDDSIKSKKLAESLGLGFDLKGTKELCVAVKPDSLELESLELQVISYADSAQDVQSVLSSQKFGTQTLWCAKGQSALGSGHYKLILTAFLNANRKATWSRKYMLAAPK